MGKVEYQDFFFPSTTESEYLLRFILQRVQREIYTDRRGDRQRQTDRQTAEAQVKAAASLTFFASLFLESDAKVKRNIN